MPRSTRRATSTRVTSARAGPARTHITSARKTVRIRRIVAPSKDKRRERPFGQSRLRSVTNSEWRYWVRSMDGHALPTAPRRFGVPILLEDGPERLVVILPVLEKRLAQQPFLHGAHLTQRAVAASVPYRGPGFQPMHADRLEGEVQQELGAFLEHAAAPVGRTNSESPFGGAETGFELAQLKDPDGGIRRVDRDREAGV